jgi:hypothetical protein
VVRFGKAGQRIFLAAPAGLASCEAAPLGAPPPTKPSAAGSSDRKAIMRFSKTTWLVAGLAGGLVIGLNLAGLWPQAPLHAVATHGQENFAICTAPLDMDIEGVFILDDVTGDLKGAALNLQMRRITTYFEYNITQDLPTTNVKNAHYRIVSGMANIRQNVVAGNLANSVLYVAEVTTGQVVVYGIPWIQGRASAPTQIKTTLVPLDRWQFRTTAIRNP